MPRVPLRASDRAHSRDVLHHVHDHLRLSLLPGADVGASGVVDARRRVAHDRCVTTYTCRHHACPRRAPVAAEVAPTCYTCGQPMDAAPELRYPDWGESILRRVRSERVEAQLYDSAQRAIRVRHAALVDDPELERRGCVLSDHPPPAPDPYPGMWPGYYDALLETARSVALATRVVTLPELIREMQANVNALALPVKRGSVGEWAFTASELRRARGVEHDRHEPPYVRGDLVDWRFDSTGETWWPGVVTSVMDDAATTLTTPLWMVDVRTWTLEGSALRRFVGESLVLSCLRPRAL